MLKKVSLMSATLCLLFAAPLAMAGEYANSRQTPAAGQVYSAETSYANGLCHRGPNGSGEVINWVKNESQCQNSSSGQSWVRNGIVIKNYQRGK